MDSKRSRQNENVIAPRIFYLPLPYCKTVFPTISFLMPKDIFYRKLFFMKSVCLQASTESVPQIEKKLHAH